MSIFQWIWPISTSRTEAREKMVRLTYLDDLSVYDHEKPYELWVNATPALPRTNCQFVEFDVPLKDVRNVSNCPSFEETGVKFLSHKSAFTFQERAPDQDNMDGYLAESAALINTEMNADKVFIFDWRYRKNNFGASKPGFDFLTAKSHRSYAHNPSHVVHSDESFESGREKMRRYLSSEEFDDFDFDQYRVRTVNLWRPLIEVVEDAPLVFADRRTVKRSDYIPFDRVLNDRVVEELYLLHRPYHNWFWLSKQKCTEPVMFITWDSLSMGSDGDQSVANVPHTSFIAPPPNGEYIPRESIELRAIVVTKRE